MLIAVLVLSSLVMAGCVFAESLPKPSIPEFTVEFFDNSYDVPPAYEIDPYTGENVTVDGYYVENKTIQLTIKNQPFVSYYDENIGRKIFLHYDVRVKGYEKENWTRLYFLEELGYLSENVPFQSDSDYTVLSYHSYESGSGDTFVMGGKMLEFPLGSEVDFQVAALVGYIHRSQITMYIYVFEGESSGWSNTQTLIIGENQNPTPLPSEKPQQIGQEAILGVVITVAVLAIGLGLLVYLIKRK